VVLRRSAPTRPPRRRLVDPDAAADLPAPNLAGYVRDRRGTWRYAATGRAVPGARDLTLGSLYRFPVRRDAVHVPADLARSEPELVWTLAWKHTLTAVLHEGRLTSILRIPVGEWERRADIPCGLWAPELTATQLLGIGAVARLAGVTAATISAYLARGRMPAPVTRIGNSPVWSRPLIQQWLASRPGQGVRGQR
jgi:predicted DNA-binding transcriptional regulator AlpA